MSTRCNITVCKNKTQKLEEGIILWRHWDGYPGKPDGSKYGVMVDLAALLPDVVEYAGFNAENTAAQILAWLVRLGQDSIVKRTFPDKSGNGLGLAKQDMFTSYTIDKAFYGDVEYIYRVDPDGVTAYAVNVEWVEGGKGMTGIAPGKIKSKKVVGKWTYEELREQRKYSALDILLKAVSSKRKK